MLKKYTTLLILMIVICICVISLAQAQTPMPSSGSVAQTDDLTRLDTIVKITGGIIGGLVTLIGLPIVILNFQKTRAEIRKLELEAIQLQNQVSSTGEVAHYGNKFTINDSSNVNVQILADPRFLAPLLLLLDFIFAWGILTLAGYVISFFIPGIFYFIPSIFRTVLTALLAAILIIPIIREARRVRRILQRSNDSVNENSARDKPADDK